jgi:polyisoprenoid-binding protein YceI
MSHAQRLLPCILTLILVAPAQEPTKTATYEITHAYSNVSFNITKFFFKEEGGFRQYSGNIFYDSDRPERSRVEMVVQAESIYTRDEGRDRALRSGDFVDVARYPTLSFVSTSVVPKQNVMLDVARDLAIHGVTRHITIPAHFLGTRQMQGWGDFIGSDTQFTIDRPEFGVDSSRWSGGAAILGKDVEVALSVGAFREGDR